jgi:Tfp pilus assembly protein PilX
MLTAMRLSALRRRLDACLRVLRDERGIALVMALGILMVLTLALATVIFMTSSGARDAKRTNAGQKAYAAAEAGLNNVIAEIASHYPSGSAGSLSWAAAGTASYDGATASWSGTFTADTSTMGHWNLTGTGTVSNPTGSGSASVVRVVKARLDASAGSGFPFGVYSGDPNASCTQFLGGITVNVPVYVASCLTLGGNFSGYDAKIWQPPPYTPASVTVQAGKALSLTGGSQIGTPARPVKNIWYGTTCSPSPCNSANGYNGPVSSPGPAQSGLPTANAATIYSSVPWASASCTGTNPFDNDSTRNNSKGNVDLTTLATYSCSVTDSAGQVHSISYNSATHALAIQNSWFIDGNLLIGTHNGLKYTGDGTIYFNGTVWNQGTVCGPPSVYTVPDGCTKIWDPTVGNQLLIVALNGLSTPAVTSWKQDTSSAIFEAGAWAIGKSSTGDCSGAANPAFSLTGNGWFGGSVFTDKGYACIAGNGVIHSSLTLPSGAPQNWTLSLHPTNYRGG